MWEGLGEYKRKSRYTGRKHKRELKAGLDEFQTNAWNQVPFVTKALLFLLLVLLLLFLTLILLHRSELPVWSKLPGQQNPVKREIVPTPRPETPALVAEEETRIFAGPDERCEVIGILDADQWAEVAGASLDAKWWVIQIPGAPDGLGWVLAQNVDVQSVQIIGSRPGMTLSDNQLGPGSPQLVAVNNIEIMAGPGTQYETLGYLEAGETAAVIGVSPDRQWWAIKIPYYESGRGWVAASNVKSINVEQVQVLQADDSSSEPSLQNQEALEISVVTNVNVRSGPGLTYSKVGLLNTGDTADAVGVDPERFWVAIQVPGSKAPGWIAVDYVDPQDIRRLAALPVISRQASGGGSLVPFPASGIPQLTAIYVVNIRSGPGTQFQVLGKLEQGQQAEVIGASEDGLWWVIKLDGVNNDQGWVAAAYVRAENVTSVPVIR